ncbi:MAG: biotin--[acetyl-CoA-carboxylase] ligase [Desulfovibrionaceae bacterium]|jgi:BirA family biotin operon repressor/biotin-[acetyl-CoA-carboxylase] ligase|nr:biotin--[acetyl-CoA-carboxylase] ligase [Desulfovibrionaceae bacterium]
MHPIHLLSQGLGDMAAPLDLKDSTAPSDAALAGTGWDADLRAQGPWRAPHDGAGQGSPQGGDADLPPGTLVGPAEKGCAAGPVFVCGQATSAFDVAWALHAAGLFTDSTAVLAAIQTSGRGQMRRPWHSPAGNLHVVVRWVEPAGLARLTPLVAGLALVRALEETLGALAGAGDLRIKWPNDVLFRDSKIAGVLVEERGGAVAVGMGLNLRQGPPPSALRDGWAVPGGVLPAPGAGWGGRAQAGPLGAWLALAPALLAQRERLHALAATAGAGGALRVADEVAAHLAWTGRWVRVVDGGGGEVCGVLRGLSADGGLTLADGARRHVLHSGSVVAIQE